MKKKLVKKKKDYRVKKSLAFKLLILSLIVLMSLIVVYIFVYESNIGKEEKELGGELGTLKFGTDAGTNIILKILSYNKNEDNQTMEVNINWTEGDDMLNSIFIEFNKAEEMCNYTLNSNLMNLGENKTYSINKTMSSCVYDFANITSIEDITAIAGIEVVITTISVNDVKLYKEQNLTLNLSNYFSCNYAGMTFGAFSDSKNISLNWNGTNNMITFSPDYGWFGQSDCMINVSCRFENSLSVFNIVVSPNLTQIRIIPNVTIYKNENLTNIRDLDDYFSSDANDKHYNFSIPPAGTQIYINYANVLGIYANSTNSYVLKQNITAISGYDDIITTFFYINYLNYTRPPANHVPNFNRSACDDLIWNKNTNYVLNMTKCWKDADGDSLTLRYENRSNANVSISQSGMILTLIPNSNWVGTGYFYLYADDGKVTEDESAKIDFVVRNPPVANGTNTTNTSLPVVNNDPAITSSNPASSEVSILSGNKTFLITAEKYTDIKWYLNNIQVVGTGSSLSFNNLKQGDVVRVDIINGTKIDSKTWNIKIVEEMETGQTNSGFGIIVFYMIIGVICIIIVLMIWLFFEEKKKKNVPEGFGFVIAKGNNTPGI